MPAACSALRRSAPVFPQVPTNCLYQDNFPLQLSGGTLMYTGTGVDSTYLQTSISNGMLYVANAGANPTFNWSVDASSGTVDVANAGGNVTFAANIYGGTIYKTGPGTMTLTGGGDNSGFNVNLVQGTLVLDKQGGGHATSGGGGGLGPVAAGALLQLGPAATTANSGELYDGLRSMNGTFDYNGQSMAFGWAFSGSGLITNNAPSTTSTMTFGYNQGGIIGIAGGADTFAGNIQNGAGGSGVMALALMAPGSNTLILTGANNSYTGGTTIYGGKLQIGDGSTSPGSLPGNVVLSSTNTTFQGSSGTTNVSGSLTFATPSGMSYTYSGNISSTGGSAGGVTKSGGGTLYLSGNNTYGTGTSISSGVLEAANTAALSLAGAVNVAGGATLAVQTNGGAVEHRLEQLPDRQPADQRQRCLGRQLGLRHRYGQRRLHLHRQHHRAHGRHQAGRQHLDPHGGRQFHRHDHGRKRRAADRRRRQQRGPTLGNVAINSAMPGALTFNTPGGMSLSSTGQHHRQRWIDQDWGGHADADRRGQLLHRRHEPQRRDVGRGRDRLGHGDSQCSFGSHPGCQCAPAV